MVWRKKPDDESEEAALEGLRRIAVRTQSELRTVSKGMKKSDRIYEVEKGRCVSEYYLILCLNPSPYRHGRLSCIAIVTQFSMRAAWGRAQVAGKRIPRRIGLIWRHGERGEGHDSGCTVLTRTGYCP